MSRLIAGIFASPLLLAAFGSASATAAPTSATNEPATVEWTVDGPVFFTPAGRALYRHTREDVRSPKFAWQCGSVAERTTDDQQSGIGPRPEIGFKLLKSCLDKFPPYLASVDAQPLGDFSLTKRPDGAMQWVYRGFPLYYSVKDRVAGQRNGVGANFGNFRQGGFVIAGPDQNLPTGLKLMRRSEGLVLAAADTERPIYTPRGGARLQPAAIGREDFKPITAPVLARVTGEWSIVDNGMGQKQYAFRGKPLYYAAASLNELEISGARGWDPIVVVKAPPLPKAVHTQLSLTGDVFATAQGRTLYTYNCNSGRGLGGSRVSCDDQGDPAAFMVALCGDPKECANRWKPYLASSDDKPVGEFSVIDITYPMFTDMRGELYPADAPRVKAWAYRGKPLFTYYEDEKPGDIWGDGVGGIWGSLFNAAQVPGRSATFFEP